MLAKNSGLAELMKLLRKGKQQKEVWREGKN